MKFLYFQRKWFLWIRDGIWSAPNWILTEIRLTFPVLSWVQAYSSKYWLILILVSIGSIKHPVLIREPGYVKGNAYLSPSWDLIPLHVMGYLQIKFKSDIILLHGIFHTLVPVIPTGSRVDLASRKHRSGLNLTQILNRSYWVSDRRNTGLLRFGLIPDRCHLCFRFHRISLWVGWAIRV
jgi:hypothetical protein